MSHRPAAARALSAVTLLSTYALVVLGDTVRVTESGMGCRSWPLCNGQLGLVGTYHALLEQSHRYLAATVTVLVVATFFTCRRVARNHRLVYQSAAWALCLIGIQVVLGAITVFTHNAGWTVGLHLAGAWLVLAAVTVTATGLWLAPGVASPESSARRTDGSTRYTLAATVAVFALAATGMAVLHAGASRACPGWPVCPSAAGSGALVALQYLHRCMALVATITLLVAVARIWRSPQSSPGERGLAAAALALLAATAAFGAIVATSGAPRALQALHLAVASALWIAVVAMAATTGTARPAGRTRTFPGRAGSARRAGPAIPSGR
ncbi:MAG: COX15/CtaA family protein [Mycobacteriales bacterium]